MTAILSLEVVSDFACPWCYIGKRRLEKAIRLRPDLVLEVTWQPFQLNPDMPRIGRNRLDYYRDKFGLEGLENLRRQLDLAAAEEGLSFDYGPDAVAPNTLSAHVLMHWADDDKSIDSNTLAEKLFEAHHVNCENIGDRQVLARIAAELGMDEAGTGSRLAAGLDEDKVKARISHFASLGVGGVPFFIINDQYSISGAQPPEILASAFDRIAGTRKGLKI